MTAQTPPLPAWSDLEGAGGVQRGEFRVVGTGVRAGAGDVLYALDASGCRHLLIPHSGAPFASDRKSAGVQIVPHTLVDGNQAAEYVDVACRREHLNELFSVVAEEMLTALTDEPDQPVAVCRRVLARWRELLDRAPSPRVSDEALVGIFGELWHLRMILQENNGALPVWRGPMGEPHDFRSAGTALEVKSTAGRNERIFEVHGIDQLEPPPGGTLSLAALGVLADDTGTSVPGLIAEIRGLGADMSALLACLANLGYDSRDDEYYAAKRYRVRSHQVFQVDAQFPRIVSGSFVGGSVPPRISALRYVVDLAGYPALDEQGVRALIAQLAEVHD